LCGSPGGQLSQEVAVALLVSFGGQAILKIDLMDEEDRANLAALYECCQESQSCADEGKAEGGAAGRLSGRRTGCKRPKHVVASGLTAWADQETAEGEKEEGVVVAQKISVAGSQVDVGLELHGLELKKDSEDIRKLTREDGTSEVWRQLADTQEKGFGWEKGLLIKRKVGDYHQPFNHLLLSASPPSTSLEFWR